MRFDRFACFSRCPYRFVLFILNDFSCSHQSKLFQSCSAFPPDGLFNQKKLLSKGFPICNACVVYRQRRGPLLLHESISLSSFYFDVTYVLSVTLFKCIWGDFKFIRFSCQIVCLGTFLIASMYVFKDHNCKVQYIDYKIQ